MIKELRFFPKDPAFDATGEVVSAVDWLGNVIRAGDPVIYCVGAGRGQRMAIGVIVELRLEKAGGRGRPPVVKVRVRTRKTSGEYDYHARKSSVWVSEMNVTAVKHLEEAIRLELG